MRRRAKTDTNQTSLTAGLRQAGVSVQPIHMIGQGCPDLLVGLAGQNYILELKAPGAPSRQRLTPDEVEWHATWRGQVAVVRTLDEALRVVGLA
jgi:hypothetical protein